MASPANPNLPPSFAQYFGELNAAELKELLSYFKAEKLSKNDFFTEAGRQCDRLSLVQTGILRIFALDEDGREITQWLAAPNSFVTEIASFFFNQNNRWSIQALSEVEMLSLHKADYLQLGQAFPKWHDIEKNFIASCFITLENRVFTHLSQSAEARYEHYWQQNKALFQQVPLQYLASVLGMSPETLSRIRKKHSQSS